MSKQGKTVTNGSGNFISYIKTLIIAAVCLFISASLTACSLDEAVDIAGELASDIGEGAQTAGREIEDIYEDLTDTTAKEGVTSREQDGSSGHSSASDLYESIIESTATGDYPTSQMQEDLDDIGLSEDRISDIKAEQEGYYYFDQLNSDQQSLYAQILHIMSCQADDIYVCTTDMDEVETV